MKRDRLILIGVVALILFGGGAIVVKLTRQQFLDLVADEVRRQLEELRPDLSETARESAAQIVAAQWAHESGYGGTRAFREGWNGGNITAGASWRGPTIPGGDLEYDDEGNAKRITQAWRQYGSLAEAISDFFKLLSWSRYVSARDALFRGDAAGYAARLRAGGYYTASEESYAAGISAALEGFA